MTPKPSKKYCRGCGHRLNETLDKAFWKFDYCCLVCRLTVLFAGHGLPPLRVTS